MQMECINQLHNHWL